MTRFTRAQSALVRCPEWERGPGASLRCGLEALDEDVEAAVVVLADGPNLAPAAVARVIESWRARAARVVAASYGGVRGHPLLVARSAWDDIPDDGLRVVEPRLVPCDDLGEPGDVDTPDDLSALERVGRILPACPGGSRSASSLLAPCSCSQRWPVRAPPRRPRRPRRSWPDTCPSSSCIRRSRCDRRPWMASSRMPTCSGAARPAGRRSTARCPAAAPTFGSTSPPAVAADGPAATACYVAAQAAHASQPVVYGAALRRKDRIELQYWIWYPWDVYSPTVPPGELWQVHEGDWESVSVIVDPRGTPLAGRLLPAWRRRAPRMDRRRRSRGTRPLAYVALGSHANYPTAGRSRSTRASSTRCSSRSSARTAGSPSTTRGGAGSCARRSCASPPTRPSWMAFAGGWGEDGYLRVPNGQPASYGATGPKGPAVPRAVALAGERRAQLAVGLKPRFALPLVRRRSRRL